MGISVPEDECHVWLAPRGAAGPELVSLLDEAERETLGKPAREADKERFLVGRSLAKLAAGHYTGADPADIVFRPVCRRCGDGSHGKPSLVAPEAPLEFSISHSGEVVGVAVSPGAPVGLDIEEVSAGRFGPAAVRRVMSPGERRSFEALPDAVRPVALHTCWTRKEAVLKATGHGLTVPPAHVEVTGFGQPPELVSWSGADGPPGPVAMGDVTVPHGYRGSVAVLGRTTLRVTHIDASRALRGFPDGSPPVPGRSGDREPYPLLRAVPLPQH